jgi:AAA15 family ATPase/GTPase
MKKLVLSLAFTLFVGVNFCYAEDDVTPVRDQILSQLNSFGKFNFFKNNTATVKVQDDDKVLEKNATISSKFNASLKRRAFINAKEALELKRQASAGTKVEIEEEGTTPTENSRLEEAMNNAQTDYQVHMAGEKMCRTAAAAAYGAEVDGSELKTEYFGDYLDKCFIINY